MKRVCSLEIRNDELGIKNNWKLQYIQIRHRNEQRFNALRLYRNKTGIAIKIPIGIFSSRKIKDFLNK